MKLLSSVTDKRAIDIEADPRRLKGARDWAFEVAVAAGLPEADCHQVRLALSEAVANSIQHGSSSLADRIRVEAFEDAGELVFEVRDGGVFDPPLARASIEDESGRGLELLALITDSVQISSDDHGSLLRFSKRLR
jgi:anti-sigma regulatory factor (Ser/Thr protein kinase)